MGTTTAHTTSGGTAKGRGVLPAEFGVDPVGGAAKLAWTATTAESGLPVILKPYKDTLSQCWHFIFGFGHGKFEIQLTGMGLCISENPKTHLSGAPLELEPCLSKSSQLWVNFGRFGSRFELDARPSYALGWKGPDMTETVRFVDYRAVPQSA